MVKAYDNDSRKFSVQSKLKNFRLRNFIEEKDINHHFEGLGKLIRKISTLVPQGPPQFKSDENKIR